MQKQYAASQKTSTVITRINAALALSIISAASGNLRFSRIIQSCIQDAMSLTISSMPAAMQELTEKERAKLVKFS